jgi:hypothetical protein
VKLPVTIALSLLLVSCSDLTPANQDNQAPALKIEKVKAPEDSDHTSPTSEPTIEGFVLKDPDTTNELMTEEKRKIISSTTHTYPAPSPEPDNGIKVAPPKLPEVKTSEEN